VQGKGISVFPAILSTPSQGLAVLAPQKMTRFPLKSVLSYSEDGLSRWLGSLGHCGGVRRRLGSIKLLQKSGLKKMRGTRLPG